MRTMGLTEPLSDMLLKTEYFSNPFDISMFCAIEPAQGIHAVIFCLFTKD